MEEYYGLICFSKSIKQLLDKKIKDKYKITKYIKEITSASIAVQIMILPVMIYSYKTILITFLTTNILTSFLITIIIIIGFVLVLISFLFMELSKILAIPYKLLINLLLVITKITSKIPFSETYIKMPYLYQIIFYYSLVFLFGYLLRKKQITKIKKYRKQIIIAILIIIAVPYLFEVLDDDLKIYFIDVGQGDSCLIITPENKKILIDRWRS